MYQPIAKRKKEVKMLETIISKSDSFICRSKVGDFQTYQLNPDDLSEEEKSAVFNAVYFIGLTAFVQNPSEKMEKDIYAHLFEEETLFVTFSKPIDWRGSNETMPRAIAFLAYRGIRINNEDVLYISGICVDPSYQGSGIAMSLMNEAYKRGFYKALALRTQNPVMKQAFDKSIGGASYPNGDMEIPENVKSIGNELSKIFKAGNYNRDTLHCINCYSSSLYGLEIESKNDDCINKEFCKLGRDKGDAMFCIKRI